MRASVAAALGASVAGVASADEVSESDTPGAPSVRGDLKRFSTTAFGAEVTGPFVFEDGSLLYSLQHPVEENPEPFGRAAVGYFSGFQFEFDGSNDDFPEVGVPDTEEKQREVRSAAGDYEVLVQGRESIDGGDARLGVTQTPDGTDITQEVFAGTQYGGAATNPDCNQFVPTNDDGTEGYLFTNWENSPGEITRVPLSQDDDGEWSADPENAMNLSDTESLRSHGGTRINCYGDLSPWGTMISAEENYAHARVTRTATVSDIVDAGSGEGLIGGCQFWNRPNPSEIAGSIETYAEDGDLESSFSPQGYWALTGVEFLAYYLGAEQADQSGDDNLATTPIDDVYPNPYRYGYFVDVREPTADEPESLKYYVMGRASWEAPDIEGDRKTVYGCSDGDSKGIYKFVADEPIDEYDDTDDIAGTLFAPKITNDAASVADSGERNSPAQTPLEVEWIPLGSATNGEVESWVAEYDDVTQADYLEAHAETDWQSDPAAAVREADIEVIENGNRNYISNEAIVEWATQYEENGPEGVDEELRRVPFLETRAAAKEIGASIEFNKAEGVDSVDDSEPGDFVYFGISEFNDALADDEGDIQMDRVDGGVVYRAELEPDYNVSTLEPMITGPDFTDSPEDADDALRNIDNVYTMRDGRVLCCEDGFGGPARSYPNDGLYVFQPHVRLDVSSVAVGQGDAVEAEVVARNVPDGIAGGEFTVSVADPDVVGITSANYPDSVGLSEAPTITDDGATASFRFADVDDAMEPADTDFTLATLTLSGRGAGVTDVDTAGSFDDDDGESVDVEARSGLAITGPANVGSGGDAPTDPDGDGHYEDVNGNGRVDYADVELLFENLESDSVSSNARAFDFNQNDRLDFDDVVSLYEEVN
ncbi:cell surface protein [Halorubrum saccharovorum]|uniref:Cell surface protein n=2 Tax=Haloferacaceae TaxID=1644056 RepID=A0A0F8AVX3_9EURY|nr:MULTISPECIES: alkaline phosphatase PhoX [Halorubrum]KKF40071.1 cell surface protein [Halorubrum saccharovorum]